MSSSTSGSTLTNLEEVDLVKTTLLTDSLIGTEHDLADKVTALRMWPCHRGDCTEATSEVGQVV